MSKKTVLTGITTTGTPHIGNYLGAIKPAIEASENPAFNSYFFLADFHALIKCQEPERVARSTREIAATWLALGLDTDKATFYRQTDIPEITELTWILTCQTSKGLMNRAHAYKAAVDANRDAGNDDLDDGVTMGLFSYPILMAADILMFNADIIPVGKDQVQHIEMARDIAGRFNHQFEPLFTLPQAQVDEETQLIPGLDGRKMSKSYNNTIPLFSSSDDLRKLINQIVTDTRAPGEPKDPDNTLMHLYRCFASEAESAAMRQRFIEGIGWGDAKKELFEYIDAHLTAPRARYNELMNDLGEVEAVLHKGAEKAREYSAPFLDQVRHAVGIRSLTDNSAGKQKEEVKEKAKSAEEIARAEEGRRRAILMQIRPLLEQVEQAEDKAAAAQALVAEKTAQVESLKKKARQKAQNELELLTEELADFL
ncbi:tryptophan--tRNA ligase [Marinobacterium weihaiense]|uniref:Tryptophan--tRNA ligase n=1 Tax=Marinobacterium weihaiense TaxID=2851016 RepID=A0ABS6M8W7_9GAMM|nr:tryptophan--tRNA ligase [Marinobacterium weihaiense]MBV0932729.1 tryptophan--tRNA ligase [Marinobacterium weihaiense]